jgi:hypothetical protein
MDYSPVLRDYNIYSDLSEMIILIEMFMILVRLSKIIWLNDDDQAVIVTGSTTNPL